jgi:hypothetical protein
VIRIDQNLINPSDCQVTLGNYAPTLVGTVSSIQSAQNQMRDRAGVWDRSNAIDTITGAGGALEYQLNLLKTQLAATASGMYSDANGNLIFENEAKTAALKLGAGILALANTKTGGEYNWRTFGTGDGFTADELITGRLMADMIQAGTLQSINGRISFGLTSELFRIGAHLLDIATGTLKFTSSQRSDIEDYTFMRDGGDKVNVKVDGTLDTTEALSWGGCRAERRDEVGNRGIDFVF